MARVCKLTGKKSLAGHNVSKAKNKTKRWQKPNLQEKRFYIPELKRTVRVRLSARALRTVSKIGLLAFARKQGLSLKNL